MIEKIPSYAQSGAQLDRVRTAMEQGMLNDPRFRRLVDTCVVMARDECGAIRADCPERGAHDRASFAAAMMLAVVYDEDGELAALKAENQRLRDMAFQWPMVRPMPTIERVT